jgi:hypothetical protein
VVGNVPPGALELDDSDGGTVSGAEEGNVGAGAGAVVPPDADVDVDVVPRCSEKVGLLPKVAVVADEGSSPKPKLKVSRVHASSSPSSAMLAAAEKDPALDRAEPAAATGRAVTGAGGRLKMSNAGLLSPTPACCRPLSCSGVTPDWTITTSSTNQRTSL